MINIFDLSTGIAGTTIRTDRAQRDGSPARHCRNDVVIKASDPFGSIQDKPVTRESRRSSCKNSGETPMKKLIEHEMSKETETSQKAPGVIAKLMGLDALPTREPSAPVARGAKPEFKPRGGHTDHRATNDHRKVYHEKTIAPSIQPSCDYLEDSGDCKDVYEVSQHPSRPGHFKDEPFFRGRCRDSPSESRMALVRQKFMEAKQLATNQKLLQSKEFQDALEVLSSNKDLFLKFLEEPNSLFSKCLDEVHVAPSPPQTKRITVLKPSKSLGVGVERRTKSCVSELGTNNQERGIPGWGSTFLHQTTGSLPQPTRIVVLKPSPGIKPHNTKALITSPSTSLSIPQCEDSFEDVGTDVESGTREVADEITRQMRESFSSRRDETLMSSVHSNGYIGDESSRYRSDDENMDGECGNFSDSEIVTPTSRHSWDCVNRFDSPYSMSSFSRASCSPESSVIREAKKRLSERWVMFASNETHRDQRWARRSASTLGDVLAVTEAKKEEEPNMLSACSRGGSCDGDQDMNGSISCMYDNENLDENGRERTPSSLQRSRSVPLSCSTYDHVALDEPDGLDSRSRKPDVPKEQKRSGKSSLKDKVSSFLFPWTKKIPLEKCLSSPKADPPLRHHSSNYQFDDSVGNHIEGSSLNHQGLPGYPFLTSDGNGHRVESHTTKAMRVSPTIEKPRLGENASDNLGQPSPISILESPFEDDGIPTASSQARKSSILDCNRAISRSPPIESIARSLSWDGAQVDKTVVNPSRHSTDFLKADIEEHERVTFVQALLSSAGLGNETSTTVFARWHSLESPLNPAVLDKFLEQKEEEAKYGMRRSNRRLLFDCVNTALLEIGWTKATHPCMYSAYHLCPHDGIGSLSSTSVSEEVFKRLREWFSGVENFAFRLPENRSQVVDHVVRKEVGGNEWAEMAGSEMGELRREIEGQVLEELVGEALYDLIAT